LTERTNKKQILAIQKEEKAKRVAEGSGRRGKERRDANVVGYQQGRARKNKPEKNPLMKAR